MVRLITAIVAALMMVFVMATPSSAHDGRGNMPARWKQNTSYVTKVYVADRTGYGNDFGWPYNVGQAMSDWNRACAKVAFYKTNDLSQAHVVVRTRDLPSPTAGQVEGMAYSGGYWVGQMTVVIDPDLSNPLKAEVTSHELGHTLSSEHSSSTDTVMFRDTRGASRPTWLDRNWLLYHSLYAGKRTSSSYCK